MRALAVTLALLCSAAASAADSPSQELRAGWTAGAGSGRVGVNELVVGAADWLDLSTDLLPYVVRAPNGEIRLGLLSTDRSAIRADFGIYHVPLDRVGQLIGRDDWSGTVLSAPMSMNAAYDVGPGVLSAALDYTHVSGEGRAGSTAESAVAAVSNLQVAGRMEFRIASHAHWWAHGWVVAAADDVLQVRTEVELEDGARAEIVATQRSEGATGAWAATSGFRFSGGATNVVLGAGYGNFAVPGLNLILEHAGLIPEIELYWRW